MHSHQANFAAWDAAYRRDLINTLPGPRALHLIGTLGPRKLPNLGLFSSVVHLGAAPPLLGFVLRPLTVPRHTYHHLKAQGCFTINSVHPAILPQAHQCSANYPLEVSEFEATGLTPHYGTAHAAPYVAESAVKIGLHYVEEHHIRANDTLLIVGEIIELILPDEAVAPSGHIDHSLLDTLAVAGLDTYFATRPLGRLPYARP